MKKFAAMAVLALLVFDLAHGIGTIAQGTFNTLTLKQGAVSTESARWAGHYEAVEGFDASGMSVTG